MYYAAVHKCREGRLTGDFSLRSIQEAFEELAIPITHRKLKKDKYRCRYQAEQANLIWHCDIHDHGVAEERRKLIAFIDDASRLTQVPPR
jgi:hypothetical protein